MNGTLQRWRVVLDMGMQHQTVYVKAINRRHAIETAEGLAPGRCLAVLNQVGLAADQSGPVDGDGTPLGHHGRYDTAGGRHAG